MPIACHVPAFEKPIDPIRDAIAPALKIAGQILASRLTIYDSLETRQDLFFSNAQIEALLCRKLAGLDLNLPLRTRSKAAKSAVCRALGYPVPNTFTKTQPRFKGQNFDTYVQKADNFQIWNEDIDASRRYVFIRVDDNQVVRSVKVMSGEAIALLDTTGTLTQKYQASARKAITESVLVAEKDTAELQARMAGADCFLGDQVRFSDVLPIREVYNRLLAIVGKRIRDPGHEQERNRGAALHAAVEKALGGAGYSDSGQFPDIADQLVEVKLQTSRTIDLGLVLPDDTDTVAAIPQVRHCDVRYAIVYGHIKGRHVVLDHVVVSPGEAFFSFFRRFEGKKINRKIQIHLPKDFFRDADAL
jgi:hypothetical protein